MSDKVEVQIKIAQGRKSFSILEAAMLWCELDSHDERFEKWIRWMFKTKGSGALSSLSYSPYLPFKTTNRLRELSGEIGAVNIKQEFETEDDELNKLSNDKSALEAQAKEVLENIRTTEAWQKHNIMHDRVSTLVRNMIEICGDEKTELDRKIAKDQLKKLAKFRNENPRFLIPEGGKGTEGDGIHPRTRAVWLRFMAALCLKAGYDPRDHGILDSLTNLTSYYGLDVGRSTIDNILNEIRDTVELPRSV